MIFESPKPEDLNFDFSLENTGSVITVRKYRDFNDELARKLFPRSSADYVPSNVYTLPDGYFCTSFWDSEKRRLKTALNVWISNQSMLATAISNEKTDDPKFTLCMDTLVTIIDMYEWMLDMCWNGDRSKPPMPLYLYKARLSELKDANLLALQELNDLFCKEKHVGGLGDDMEISDRETIKRIPEWKATLIERIDEIFITLDKIANAGEDVKDAIGIATDIRRCIVTGKISRDDFSNKLKILDETVARLEKKVAERRKMVIDKTNEDKSTLSTKPSVSDSGDCSNGIVQLSNSGRRSNVTKRGRPKSSKLPENGNHVVKRRTLATVVDYSEDDLVARVKRGERNRRPARLFTPCGTPSFSTAPRATLFTRPTPPVVKVPPPATKRASPSTSIAPSPLSPDSGRPSSNESIGNVTTVANGKHLSADAQQKDGATNIEHSTIAAPAQSLPNESSVPSQNNSLTTTSSVPTIVPSSVLPQNNPLTTTSSVPTIVPSTSFSTPITSLSVAKAPQPPPLNLDDQSLLAIWKEKIQLGDVRITLLNMLATDAMSKYHFIPLVVETIDKATAALDNKDMIAYTMHKAAIEVGCTELGNIMRSSNPVDPTSQIAALATAMGLNPAPFTSMIQPSTLTTGLTSDVLVDLHEAASVVAAREKLTGSFSLPAQTLPTQTLPAQTLPDPLQGYTERDLTNYLL